MVLLPSHRARRLIALFLSVTALGACSALEPERLQYAIVDIATQETENGFVTRPSAFFFTGANVTLSSTHVGTEGCIVRPLFPQNEPDNLPYIDAGTSITVQFPAEGGVPAQTATLTPGAVGDQILYTLPSGTFVPFSPGVLATITTPGVATGFPQRTFTAPTVEAFSIDPVTIPTRLDEDMVLRWRPASTVPGTAIFVSLRYSFESTSLNREVACAFFDDGQGVIQFPHLTDVRESTQRELIVQRGLVTTNRSGNVVTHVTSSMQVEVPITD
jgi:hypothetical protein